MRGRGGWAGGARVLRLRRGATGHWQTTAPRPGTPYLAVFGASYDEPPPGAAALSSHISPRAAGTLPALMFPGRLCCWHTCFRPGACAWACAPARVGKAGGGGAGRGDGRVGLRDGAARRWGAASEVAVRGCDAAAGGARRRRVRPGGPRKPSSLTPRDGGGLRVRRRGEGCGLEGVALPRSVPAAADIRQIKKAATCNLLAQAGRARAAGLLST